ncbi:hypothetical protein ACLIKE_03035 [Ferroplasma acidiphilum]|uniref:Uncharacterized protein n=1 Tax=Ferroplasma acidiphilum TaxID=74969 RepID=A0A7K4FNB6_9ARCH|nr:hypothetical protein [Ferroplasma acidiphilum]NOL60520.1 hypothetical protein [Ferroplasma acidiphilum]
MEYIASQEILLNIYGDIIVDKKILASIKINKIPNSELKPQIEDGKKFALTNITLNGYIELDKELVDHIERSRDSNPESDVIFNVKLTASHLENKAVLSYVTELSISILNQNTSKIIRGMRREYTPSDISLLVYAYPNPTSTYNQGRSNLNLISTSGTGNGYIAHKSITMELQCKIPSSKWVNNYAPKLGIGNFLILEIPFYKNSDNNAINEALKLIGEAEKAYRAWDADTVLLRCRKAVELLGNAINKDSGAWKKFHRIVAESDKGLFGFLSLGEHPLPRKKGSDNEAKPVEIKDLNPEAKQYDAEAALYFTKILVKYTAELLRGEMAE